MEIRESLHQDWVATVDPAQLTNWLHTLLNKKEDEISTLRERIIKFEQKVRAQDAFYQSLSPIRKLFTGRAPSHHQAVEYMVNVKDRMRKIETLKLHVNEITHHLEHLEKAVPDTIELSHSILEDLSPLIMQGDTLK